jgi:hypothetical protein
MPFIERSPAFNVSEMVRESAKRRASNQEKTK